ncbi:MAG: 50S ribosomal protein L44e [Candidatus Bathyarchaeota archaeon]
MKIEKEIRTYCKTCKKHTVHKVSVLSVGHRRGKLSQGERRKSRRDRGIGGHGQFSKVPVSRMARRSKTSRKIPIKLTCSECGKASQRSIGRMAKVEIKR